MKNTRSKLPLTPTITTRDEAELAVNTFARVEASRRKLISDRDAMILDIENQFTPALSQLDAEKEALLRSLSDWATANPSEFPKDRKSLDLQSGTIGFRTGTPKLALLSRAWSWEKILGNLRDYMPGFVRKKEEVDREKIIAERTTFPLSNYGLKIVQEETFYVEPNLETPEARTTQTL